MLGERERPWPNIRPLPGEEVSLVAFHGQRRHISGRRQQYTAGLKLDGRLWRWPSPTTRVAIVEEPGCLQEYIWDPCVPADKEIHPEDELPGEIGCAFCSILMTGGNAGNA